MASVRLNGDTSGFIEISAPSVAGSTTITLPATSGGNFLVTDSNGDLNVDSGTLFVDASTNRVGVGTSSPSQLLTVANTNGGNQRLQRTGLADGNASDATLLEFANGTGAVAELRCGGDGDLQINTKALSTDSYNNSLFIKGSTGNVGIGTTSPTLSSGLGLHLRDDNVGIRLNPSSNGGQGYIEYANESDTVAFITGYRDAENTYNICPGTSLAADGGLHITSGGLVGVGNNDSSDIQFGLNIAQSNDNAGALGWTDGGGTIRGSIQVTGTGDALRLRTGTGNTDRISILPNGHVGFACDTRLEQGGIFFRPNISNGAAEFTWNRADSALDSFVMLFHNNTNTVGSISHDNVSTAYNTSSDYRLKENVIDLEGAIDRVKKLLPRRFNFLVNPEKTVDGFIAHEVQDVVPESVVGKKDAVQVWEEGDELPDGVSVGANKLDEDGNTIPIYQGIDQSKLVPLLTAALQEAISKIETLETRLSALEGGTN